MADEDDFGDKYRLNEEALSKYEGNSISIATDGTTTHGSGTVPKDEYLYYLRARKRIEFNEPIPESTFTDVQNPVLRRRLVRAICLKKASNTTSATSKESTQETT